jgi:hypothetical protein
MRVCRKRKDNSKLGQGALEKTPCPPPHEEIAMAQFKHPNFILRDPKYVVGVERFDDEEHDGTVIYSLILDLEIGGQLQKKLLVYPDKEERDEAFDSLVPFREDAQR